MESEISIGIWYSTFLFISLSGWHGLALHLRPDGPVPGLLAGQQVLADAGGMLCDAMR